MIRAWLDKNESPADVPQAIKERALALAMNSDFARYSGPHLSALREELAAVNAVRPESIVIGNGSDECILIITMAFGGPGKRAILPAPTFGTYRDAAVWTRSEVVQVPRLMPDFELDMPALESACRSTGCESLARASRDASSLPAPAFSSIVFICRPNNPTGNICPASDVERLLSVPGCLVVVDEAYFEFCGETLAPWIATKDNLIILRTFSKAYSIAGLRVGYMIAPIRLAGELEKYRLMYNVNVFSQAAALVALQERKYFLSWANALRAASEQLQAGLSKLPGVRVLPSVTNFVMFSTPIPAPELYDKLRSRGVLLRAYPDDPIIGADWLRVSIGSPTENALFLREIEELLRQHPGFPA